MVRCIPRLLTPPSTVSDADMGQSRSKRTRKETKRRERRGGDARVSRVFFLPPPARVLRSYLPSSQTQFPTIQNRHVPWNLKHKGFFSFTSQRFLTSVFLGYLRSQPYRTPKFPKTLNCYSSHLLLPKQLLYIHVSRVAQFPMISYTHVPWNLKANSSYLFTSTHFLTSVFVGELSSQRHIHVPWNLKQKEFSSFTCRRFFMSVFLGGELSSQRYGTARFPETSPKHRSCHPLLPGVSLRPCL